MKHTRWRHRSKKRISALAGPSCTSKSVLNRTVSEVIKRDKTAHMEGLAEEAQQAAEAHDTRKVYSIIKQLKPAKKAQAQTVVLEDGSFAKDRVECRKRWQRFFAAKLCGNETSFKQAMDDSVASQMEAIDRVAERLKANHLPTVQMIASWFASGKIGRGYGEDAIPAELFKLAPWILAKRFLPLWLKVIHRLGEPLAWKGGCLSELWKGKGNKDVCDNSRGILVSDFLAKLSRLASQEASSSLYQTRTSAAMRRQSRDGR